MKASTSRTVSAKVLHSIVSVLLVFAMVFVFSACQSDTVDPNETVDIGGGSEGEHNTPAQTFLEWQRPYVEDHIASDDPVLKSL